MALDKPKDIVVTYTVTSSTNDGHVDDTVHAALKDGYRVIEIIMSPYSTGCAVTVLLSIVTPGIDHERNTYYIGHKRA